MVFVRTELVRLIEGGKNLVANEFCLLRCFQRVLAQIFQHHHKLVTTKAGNCVAFTHTGNQPFGNQFQQQVTDVMTKRIIEVFEVVQINKKYRAFLAATPAGGQRLLQPVLQQAPVRQAGKVVKECQILDLFFLMPCSW